MILYYHKETQQSIQHGGFIMRNLEATERLRTMNPEIKTGKIEQACIKCGYSYWKMLPY